MKCVMKRLSYLIILLVAVTAMFTSCKKEEFSVNDIFGTWQCASEGRNPEGNYQYWVFSEEKTGDEEYPYYGHTWDEGDDVHESDLTDYGNGWFKYKVQKADLEEIHMMEYGWSDIPKTYTITILNSTTLSYKDSFGKSHTLTRVR